jgi:hypothetical protein
VSNDGQLDLDELGKMTGFAKLAKRLMGKADVDRSGQLTMDEWVTYIESKGDQAAKVLQLYENALTTDADAHARTGVTNEHSPAGAPPSTPRPPPSPRAAAAAAADAAAAAAVIQNAASATAASATAAPPPAQPRVLIMPEAPRGVAHTDEHFPMPSEATGGGAAGVAAGGAAGRAAGGAACGGRAALLGDGSVGAAPGRTPRGVLSASARGDMRGDMRGGGNSRGSTSSSVRPSPSTISLERFEQRAVRSTSRPGPAAGLSLTKVYFSRK